MISISVSLKVLWINIKYPNEIYYRYHDEIFVFFFSWKKLSTSHKRWVYTFHVFFHLWLSVIEIIQFFNSVHFYSLCAHRKNEKLFERIIRFVQFEACFEKKLIIILFVFFEFMIWWLSKFFDRQYTKHIVYIPHLLEHI